MPAIIDKIADALHLNKHHKTEEHATADTAEGSSAPAHETTTKSKAPVFDHEKVTVLFVLGGPGAGEPLPHARKDLCRRVLTLFAFVQREGDTVRTPRTGLRFLPPVR